VVTAAVHIRGQLVAETGLDQFTETEVKANATAKADVSHHVAEIHADLGLSVEADDVIDREGETQAGGRVTVKSLCQHLDQGVCTPVISARYWKNARLRSDVMPQLTGGD
jgi:hypothetical protein